MLVLKQRFVPSVLAGILVVDIYISINPALPLSVELAFLKNAEPSHSVNGEVEDDLKNNPAMVLVAAVAVSVPQVQVLEVEAKSNLLEEAL